MPQLRNLFLLLIIATSCKEKNSETLEWKAVDSAGVLQYTILKKGTAGEQGDFAIKYFGHLDHNKIIQDSLIKDNNIITGLINNQPGLIQEFKKLGKGTTGYVKLNTEALMNELMASIPNYQMFYRSVKDDKVLRQDSAVLASLNMFATIKLVTSADAIKAFEKDNDTTWRNFIKTNPLPASIDLTLKKEWRTKTAIDSVQQLITSRTHADEIKQSAAIDTLLSPVDNKEKELLFRFIIF